MGEGGSPDTPGQDGGLLSKLLDVLLSEPCDSKYRRKFRIAFRRASEDLDFECLLQKPDRQIAMWRSRLFEIEE